jgi:hypothetical protein
MSERPIEINRGALRPIVCYQQGWNLIKDDYWLFLGIVFVGLLIGSLGPLNVLMGAMWCGIEICLLRRMANRNVEFRHLFDGFNYFMPSLVATMAIVIPMTVLFILSYAAFALGTIALVIPQAQAQQQGGGGPPDPSFFASLAGLWVFLLLAIMVIAVALSAPTIFMYALIVEHKLSGVAALVTSIRGIFANFWRFIGLLIVVQAVGMVGTMLLCVGVVFVLPVTFAAYAIAYRQVFGEMPREVVLVDEDPEVGSPVTSESPETAIQADAALREPPATGITSE